MNILNRFRRQAPSDPASLLYQALAAQSRRPEFYVAAGVPDSLDGRFDLLVLHVILLLRRLKSEGATGRALGQAIFDVMVTDFDRAVRELGGGDVGVGKRIKAMISAFYGRLAAYDAALAEADDAALQAALRRNVYGTVKDGIDAAWLGALSAYVRREAEGLARQEGAALIGGMIDFAPPPGGASRASP